MFVQSLFHTILLFFSPVHRSAAEQTKSPSPELTFQGRAEMLAVPPCFALSSRKKPQPLRPRMKRVTARHCNGCARHALAKGSRTQLRGHVQLCPLCSLPPTGNSLKKPAQLTLLVIVFCVYSILYTSFRGCQANFSAAVRPAALRRAPASGPFGNAKTR